MILQHDNARPYVAKSVKTYLETLKWEVLPHPPYSPDIAPSDYYMFRSMAHGLPDQQFRSYEDIEKWLDSWIALKHEYFHRNSIRALPEKWSIVSNFATFYFFENSLERKLKFFPIRPLIFRVVFKLVYE